MIRKMYWHVSDKWKRHLGLIGSRRLRRHIPATRLLSKRNLRVFLARYRIVFVKPVYGSFGNRIMKIARSGRSTYKVHRENRIRRVPRRRIAGTVFRHARGRRFMLQKGVSILKLRGRPVDFRVLMLRPHRRWQTMGIMGKVATGRRIVTNYNHGGKAARFRSVLRKAGYSRKTIRRIESRMLQISRAAAHQFNRRYKHCRRLGIDIAIDRQLRLWILEVNTNPFYNLFRHHENKKLYGRIRRNMGIIRKKQSRR